MPLGAFPAFVKKHAGSGLNMKELAKKYRDQNGGADSELVKTYKSCYSKNNTWHNTPRTLCDTVRQRAHWAALKDQARAVVAAQKSKLSAQKAGGKELDNAFTSCYKKNDVWHNTKRSLCDTVRQRKHWGSLKAKVSTPQQRPPTKKQVLDPVEFARMIDLASQSMDTPLYVPKTPVKQVKQQVKQTLDKPSCGSSIDAIAAALEKAATKEDQLMLSCGLPLVMDPATNRYRLAPTAAAVLQFTREQEAKPKSLTLNVGASTMFAQRLAAAKKASQNKQRA